MMVSAAAADVVSSCQEEALLLLALFLVSCGAVHDDVEASKELARWVLECLDFARCDLPTTEEHVLAWKNFALVCAKASMALLTGKDPSCFDNMSHASVCPLVNFRGRDIVEFRGTHTEEVKAGEFRLVMSMMVKYNLCEKFPWLQPIAEDIERLHIDLTGRKMAL